MLSQETREKIAKALGASRVIKISDKNAGGPLDLLKQANDVKNLPKQNET